ncbi:MAG TPA: ABC transporter ATP-binding protein [Candidatus Ornithoclostridium excrementipullorum]|nr:ABC transporter ATP-binding protein [Candidatus Ornithoclostridium excrementipullorum]
MKKKGLPRLMEYAGGYRRLTYLSWVLSALSALLALVPFVFIWLVVKEALEVAPDFSAAHDMAFNGWMAVLFAVLSMLIYFAALMCSHVAAFRVASNIRRDVMKRVTELPVGFLERIGSGRARKIVNESSAATETYLAHQLPDMAGSAATAAGMIALLFVFDWILGLVSLLPVVVSFVIMGSMIGPDMKKKMAEYQNSLDEMSNEAVEYVRGISVVKAFGQSVFSFKKFKASIDNYGKWVIDYTKSLRRPMIFYTLAINFVFALLIAVALGVTAGGNFDGEFLLDLIFYVIFTPIIGVTLNKIMFASENSMIVQDALERIDLIMDEKPFPIPSEPKLPSGADVELENVSFAYAGADRKALDGVSVKAGAGQTVALVGPSGGGKTTVAGLIAGFWRAQSGSVRIGGADVADMTEKTLADTVAYVFQDSRLLKASVADNVKLARPNASRIEVENALHIAQCDDIIAKLPDGIDTVIGTKGVYLSGGEMQRIAIARAVIKDAPVILLDEATAFADPENEYAVQKAFEKLSENKTVIMIAHRLTTVRGADRIYVLEDGKVTESGRHDELVEAGGTYSKMWSDYLRSVEWKVAKEA